MGLDIWALLISIIALLVAGLALTNSRRKPLPTEPQAKEPTLSESTQDRLADLSSRATLTLLKLNMLGEQNAFRTQVIPHIFQLIDQLDKMDTLIKQDSTNLGDEFFRQKLTELQEVEGAITSLSSRITIEMGQQPA